MKIKRFVIITTFFLMFVWMTACKTNAPVSNNSANQNVTKTVINTNQPENKTAVSDDPIGNIKADKSDTVSLETPTEAYKTAYAARKNKDLKTLKRVLSKDMIEFFTMMGDSEKKTVDEELKELAEQPQSPTDESRNEKITGEAATLEYKDESGKWKTMDFIKESNEWKLTIPDRKSPVISDTYKKTK